MSKKLEEKQRRRLAEEKRQAERRKAALRRNLVTIVVAVVVGALVVFAIVSQRNGESTKNTAGATLKNDVAAADANCSEVQTFESAGRDHMEVGATPDPPYNSSPPTSGDHYAVPADTGFYRDALPPEQVIHNEEHGQIIIWYRPDAPESLINDIEALVNQQPDATVATPYDGEFQDDYQFVISAWTHMQSCEKISQDVVDAFRTKYQGKSPEPLTPPFKG
ncbi:MAG TPA: DUF3105 domain-containing protein [Actinomycetota bacterium]|nr:DUF3105 domain-containing protein [Actinomycetota bacterium]